MVFWDVCKCSKLQRTYYRHAHSCLHWREPYVWYDPPPTLRGETYNGVTSATEQKHPVGFHVLPGDPTYGFHLMPDMPGGMRAYNASPLQLEDVLVKFLNLRLYIMYGGWPGQYFVAIHK